MFTLLIVDDDELIRKGLEMIIPWPELGFTVSASFPDALSALDYLREHRVDVILTDVKMPGMSGLELVGEAKKLNPSIKAVIISGYSEFELVKNALLLKAEDYLLKPLSQSDIEEVFRKIAGELGAEPVLPGALDTCYALIRQLSEESRLSGVHEAQERVCLLYCPDDCGMYLAEGLMAAAKEDFLAALVPEDALEEMAGKLKGPGRKLMIGSAMSGKDDLVPSFWSAFNLLPRTAAGSVSFAPELDDDKPRRVISEAKDWLISRIESGDGAEAGPVISKVRELDSGDQGYVYCSVILKLLHYFSIDPGSDSFRYSSCGFSSASLARLEEFFRSDLEELMRSLSMKGDSHGRLLAIQAERLVKEKYADTALSLSRVAEALGISYGYLSTVFSQHTGKSFKRYLVEVRMEKARELLLSREYRVYEIAGLTGYTSTKYFTEAFQRYYGSSPSKYLQNLGK